MNLLPTPEKKPWQSKTLWVGIITAAAAFIPAVNQWITEHPETFATGISVAFAVLRLITKDKIVIS